VTGKISGQKKQPIALISIGYVPKQVEEENEEEPVRLFTNEQMQFL